MIHDAFDEAMDSVVEPETAPWPPPIQEQPLDVRMLSKAKSVEALKRLGAETEWGD